MSKFIRSFTVIPKELFRMNNGPLIRLRDRSVKKEGSFDLFTVAGKVQPKALDPATYSGSDARIIFLLPVSNLI
jgi:hypothetical protein